MNILYKLISQNVKNESISKKNFLTYLDKHPEVDFKFTIPQHECTETFVNFIKDFSNKTYNRQRFEFVIE